MSPPESSQLSIRSEYASALLLSGSHPFPPYYSSPSSSYFLPLHLHHYHHHHLSLSLMDKSDRETHDFMNVESFSQLPFIRPPPLKDKPLKLFGIEFPNADSSSFTPDDAHSSDATNNNAFDLDSKDAASASAVNNAETSRRFECHYCCRNFPTSQALGGHQNAHKRERQHAKRAHLQSAMVHNSLSADAAAAAHVYGLMNYHRMGSNTLYPSWHNSNSAGGRFYGSHGTTPYPHLQPINGSPLALWRIPATVQNNPTTTFNRDRSLHLQHPLPLLAGDEINVGASHQVVGSASQNRLVYDSAKPGVHDHRTVPTCGDMIKSRRQLVSHEGFVQTHTCARIHHGVETDGVMRKDMASDSMQCN